MRLFTLFPMTLIFSSQYFCNTYVGGGTHNFVIPIFRVKKNYLFGKYEPWVSSQDHRFIETKLISSPAILHNPPTNIAMKKIMYILEFHPVFFIHDHLQPIGIVHYCCLLYCSRNVFKQRAIYLEFQVSNVLYPYLRNFR